MIQLLLLTYGCNGNGGVDDAVTEPTIGTDWECTLDEGSDPDFASQLGCQSDFDALASLPLDASIPGARSVKSVLDQSGGDTLYFQNSVEYQIHWEFAFEHLNADNGHAPVPDLGTFNLQEYYSPDRRFLLGAITFYEGPQVWTYEIAPYDTASADQVTKAFRAVRDNMWIGGELFFHPSSENVAAAVVPGLPDDIPVITTDELFAGITYQPLNLGTTKGTLGFREADSLAQAYINPCEVVVLDAVPNDISITAGIITDAFQTPLAHINVLAQNRGTPNMGLKGAFTDEELRGLEGKWVELTVGPFEYTIAEVSAEEGQQFCDQLKPDPIATVPMDLSVTTITDMIDVLDLDNYSLGDALDRAIPAFGGKASHYGGLVHIGEDVPVPAAYVIPVFFYNEFMTAHGFYDEIAAMLALPEWEGDAALRAGELTALQDRMIAAQLDPALELAVSQKILTEWAYHPRMRFRSSTTAEDLGDFTGAGLYTSRTGDPTDPDRPIDEAIKTVWASVWGPRAYEEREWYGIDHLQIGMAILSHRGFPDEDANGVAITGNIFDTTGLEPGFYINVQQGDTSVVLPDAGVISDQILYYFDSPGQPVVYLAHSNLVPPGETVISNVQLNELGKALAAIRSYFQPVYGTTGGFYGMDTEFKFDSTLTGEPQLWMKQARPYPGWSAQPAKR